MPTRDSIAAEETTAAVANKWIFARHFGEMVLVMLIGMGVLSALAALVFTAAGTSTSDQPDALRVLLMGAYMTIPMVGWMRYRGHPWQRNAEMAASMMVPSAGAAALAAAGTLGIGAAMALQHAVMIPAMLGVMLWRYDEYARAHHGTELTEGQREQIACVPDAQGTR